jgi:hypothetical protein
MSETGSFDTGRFFRTMLLISLVTGVFMLVGAERLDDELVQIGLFAIGTVGFITAIISFLIAAGSYYDDTANV